MTHPAIRGVASLGTQRAIRVDCVGPLNVDLVIKADAPTDPDRLAEWVGPSTVDIRAAGPVGYTARGLASLGCAVRVFAAVGADPFGEQLIDDLAAQGIDTDAIAVLPGGTSLAIYPLLFGGGKRPMTYRMSDGPPWPDGLGRWTSDATCDVLFLGGLLHYRGLHPGDVAAVLSHARERGVITGMDPQFPLRSTAKPWLGYVMEEVRATDLFLCDVDEAMSIFGTPSAGEAARAALALGCQVAVIKMGARGSMGVDANGAVFQPAVALQPGPRTAVGAGDLFNAGFLTSWVAERSLVSALRFGTAVAACWLETSELGGRIDDRRLATALDRVPEARPLADEIPDPS